MTSPHLKTVCHLRAQAVDVVVVAIDADDARTIDGGIQYFRGLQVSGNEHASIECLVARLARRRNWQGCRSKNNPRLKAELFAAANSCRHNAVLEGERREAHRIILDIEILDAPLGAPDCGSVSKGVPPMATRGEARRAKGGTRITPHVERAAREGFAFDRISERS